MTKSLKAKYPTEYGWIHAKLEIDKGTLLKEDTALKFCIGPAPISDYEVAEFLHYKNFVRIVFRKRHQTTLEQMEKEPDDMRSTVEYLIEAVREGNDILKKNGPK